MIENELWTQTNKSEEELLDRAMEKYIASLEMFCKHVDYRDFDINNVYKSIYMVNKMINEVSSEETENSMFEFKNRYYDKTKNNPLTTLDAYKIFISSSEVYHFWNMPFSGLLKFYFENLKKDKGMTVDIYIGRLQYLFDKVGDEEFGVFEKYIILTNKIDT